MIAIDTQPTAGVLRTHQSIEQAAVGCTSELLQGVHARAVQSRSEWVAQGVLPAEHPQRRELRDRIAKSVADEFSKTDEKKRDLRLALFEEGLHLHDPVDFAPGMVNASLILSGNSRPTVTA